MAGLYFHIPFCKRVCAYCDFYKSVDLRRMDPLLESMHRELDARREYLGSEPVRTRYFGGGTPSLCAPEAVTGLLDHAATLFDCTAAEETTLEANPDDLTPAYLAVLRRAGVNRLSVGIQSFDDACLKLMNRRHNAAYWHGVKYLGIGPAAHSFDGRERHWNVASVTEYIGGTPAEAETLTDRDRFNEYVMTRLRTAEGIDLREAERLFGKERAARVLRDAEPWLKSRTLVLAAGRMAVPPARMLVSDAVIETFLETEPDTATK